MQNEIINTENNVNVVSSNFAFDELEKLRKKLLDLTARNPLISFKHRQNSIRIVDEIPDQVFTELTLGKQFEILPIPEPTKEELIEAGFYETDKETNEIIIKEPNEKTWAKHLGFDVSYDLPISDSSESEAKHSDTKIQSLKYFPILDSMLKKLKSSANTALQENGSNILYLTIGFLQWHESSDSESEEKYAPLFTIPVEIIRVKPKTKNGSISYRIKIKEDDLLTNVTLREKLLNDFGLSLPDIEFGDLPEEYFKNVERLIISKKSTWKVRRQMSLTLLNFSKQAMYLDLDPSRWPEGKRIEKHEIIERFFSKTGEEGGSYSTQEEYQIDNIENILEDFPIIYDADSSQHSALIDVINGKNIVIEGPPGTGKSQTITNIIGAAIAKGKRVLFLAEKMAALEVVKTKLDKAGLGDFCLELHSHKTNKKKILEDLGNRLNKHDTYPEPRKIKTSSNLLKKYQDDLNTYVSLVNAEWKNTEKTVHEILTKTANLKELIKIDPNKLLLDIAVNGEEFTDTKLREMHDKADMLKDVYEQVSNQASDGEITNHFWYGVQNKELNASDFQNLSGLIKKWSNSLRLLSVHWSEMSSDLQFKTNENIPIEDIFNFQKVAESLPDIQRKELIPNLLKISGQIDEFQEIRKLYTGLFDSNEALKDNFTCVFIDSPELSINLVNTLSTLKENGFDAFSLEDIKSLSEEFIETIKVTDKVSGDLKYLENNLPNQLKPVLAPSFDGIKSFKEFYSLIKRLPTELWNLRNPYFDHDQIDQYIVQLEPLIETLKTHETKLLKYFKLHSLPEASELANLNSSIERRNVISFLSADYRKVKNEISLFSISFKTDKKQIFTELKVLTHYKSTLEEAEKLNNNYAVFKELYKGSETDIGTIKKVREWYKVVRGTYGIGFGEKVEIGSEILNIDLNKITATLNYAESNSLISSVDLSIAKNQFLKDKCLKNKDIQDEFSDLSDTNNSPLYKLSNILKRSSDVFDSEIIDHSVNISLLEDKLISLKKFKQDREVLANQIKGVWLNQDFELLKLKSNDISEDEIKHFSDALIASKKLSECVQIKESLKSNQVSERYIEIKEKTEELNSIIKPVLDDFESFSNISHASFSDWISPSTHSIKSIVDRNKQAIDNANWLNTWVDYLQLKEKLSSEGMSKIIDQIEQKNVKFSQISEMLELAIFNELANEIMQENEKLTTFYGTELNAIKSKFQKYDKEIIELNKDKVAYQAANVKLDKGRSGGLVGNYSEITLIQHELGKKARHIPIRSLLDRSGKTILNLKPCFLMSPMSVAQYLKPGEIEFDLIIMDEASQILPQDALGAIARGKQLVVVGDPKQLPPTMFFNKLIDPDEDASVAGLQETDSILEAVIPMFKNRRLKWHYRSRHQDLIAFSNKYFYDDDLILFPSPQRSSQDIDSIGELGIKFHKIEGRFKAKRNLEEAKKAVEILADHVTNNPHESVGIVAMNSTQREQIEASWQEKLLEFPDLETEYLQQVGRTDPIFIKNLENVQGDERDVIIISLTYGPEEFGGKVLQRFGPINSATGWRRLNVLFTRSKKRMHIVSSLRSSDILTDTGASNRGKNDFKLFIEYCETGHLHQAVVTEKEPDSDFEIAVIRSLSEYGYECVPQVGVAGYFIDIGVLDPGMPGRYIMGIECDGATYHSAKSARDRDRLRQSFLEELGWNINRIWSTDWFKNSEAVMNDILQKLDRLKTNLVEEIEIKEELVGEAEEKEEVNNINPETKQISILTENEVTLEERLINFNENVIKKNHPGENEETRLLRPEMVASLVLHLPLTTSEFREFIPSHLRMSTSNKEAKTYLRDVLAIVSSYA